MSKFTLLLFTLISLPALSLANDTYLLELVNGVANLTRGNIFFPDRCVPIKMAEKLAMSDHPQCESRLKGLSKSVKLIDNQTAIENLLNAKRPKLVVLAENHGSPSALSFPQILYSIKKTNPETDCLFVEYPDSFGQKLKELQEQQKLPFDSQENIGLMISQNQILAADKIGLKVIPIDNHPTRIDQVKSLSKQGFRDRNLVMANAIDKNFENGTCKAGILIVGAFHWTKGGASKEVPSLKDLVKAKTASILIVNTACHPTMPAHNDPIWKWSECKNNPPIIEAEAIVETSSLSDDVNLVPSGGRWNDFDIGLITPAAYDSNCLRVR